MIKLTIMQIICNFVFTRNCLKIYFYCSISESSDMTQSPCALHGVSVKQRLRKINFRMKHSNIHENSMRILCNWEMLFLTVHINWKPCIQTWKILYSELNYTAGYSVWQKRPTHVSSRSKRQTLGWYSTLLLQYLHTTSVLQNCVWTVKKLNQMSVARLLKTDVFPAVLIASDCTFLTLERIHPSKCINYFESYGLQQNKKVIQI